MRYEKGWAQGAPLGYRARLFRRGQGDQQTWHCDVYPEDWFLLMPTQVKGRTPDLALRAAERYIAWYGFAPHLRAISVAE